MDLPRGVQVEDGSCPTRRVKVSRAKPGNFCPKKAKVVEEIMKKYPEPKPKRCRVVKEEENETELR